MTPPLNALNPNDPATREALYARLRFYRDLGLGEFYRREVDPTAWAQPEAPLETKPAVAAASVVQQPPIAPSALFPGIPEETEIAPRKPFSAAPPIAPSVPPEQHFAALKLIREDIGDCTRCALHTGRNKLVFGDGDPNARLMFVGEGPGADEDASGLPFVGRGGQLLNNMINAMGLQREQVYIANVVKCRPPQNRVPEPEEANTCTRFLFRQIEVIRRRLN